MNKLLYTTAEAAKVLSIGRSTLYLLLGRGEIESVKVGALRRISPSALDSYVERITGGRSIGDSLADGQGS
ncbi:MAG: helix-turn-helix domain-containing protein [Candidatus Dormibacteria bacterium]